MSSGELIWSFEQLKMVAKGQRCEGDNAKVTRRRSQTPPRGIKTEESTFEASYQPFATLARLYGELHAELQRHGRGDPGDASGSTATRAGQQGSTAL